jgi:hypothetical protein
MSRCRCQSRECGRRRRPGYPEDEGRRPQAERKRLPPPSSAGTEHQRERPDQNARPGESQPAHSREHTDRPPTNAAAAEPRRNPEQDR